MRFKLHAARTKIKNIRDAQEALSRSPTPEEFAIGVMTSDLEEACDEIDFHILRRTFHDTLTLMRHEHTKKCLDAYKKGFEELSELCERSADFRTGVIVDGFDEGTTTALKTKSMIMQEIFKAETGGK